jgi:hypothetical protein
MFAVLPKNQLLILSSNVAEIAQLDAEQIAVLSIVLAG